MTAIEMVPSEEALGVKLPTRRVESFHYTNLRSMLGTFTSAAVKPSDEAAKALGGTFTRLVPDACVLHFYDGHYFDRAETLPAGVTVSAGVPDMDLVQNFDETVAVINAKQAKAGVEIVVDHNVDVAQTIGLAHAHTGAAGTIAATRFVIDAGEGSKARFIERQMGTSAAQHLTSAVTMLKLAKGAEIDYFIVQQTGAGAEHLARLDVELAEDAQLNVFILNTGGKLVRQEVRVNVNGENAHLDMKGVNLVGKGAHVDVTTVLEHKVPNTTAEELFRNVVVDDGQGVFQGQIKVNQIAQKTDAQMACNTLLLSDDAGFSAKPELEIFADDVICAHGATVTDISKDHLFYLMARGVPERVAQNLLIKAFVDEVVDALEAVDLGDALTSIIDGWLDKNG